MIRSRIALAGFALATLSCTRSSASPRPAPTTSAPSAPVSSAPGAPPTARVRRPPPPRDSLAKLRAVYVKQVMASIAGRENEPADVVFKNVQVLKGLTAGQLVQVMDTTYGRDLSWNCTNCHRFAPQGNFASDTSNDKRRARFMQQMTNDLNLVQLPKLYPKDTPKVTCATCHRGYNEPPPGDWLAPERGKPGAPPPKP